MSQTSTVEPAGLSSNGVPLQVVSQPVTPSGISKKAILLLAVPVALAGAVVIYNVFSRGDDQSLVQAEKPKNIESAMDVAESINQKAERPVAPSLPTEAPPEAASSANKTAGIGAAPQLPSPASQAESSKTLTPVEQTAQRLAEERLQRLQQAMDAATKAKSFQDSGGGIQAVNNLSSGGMSQSNPYVPLGAAGLNAAALLGAGGLGKDDPNGQKDKSAFMQSAKAEIATPTLAASVRPAQSPFEINSGTVIPAVLVTGLNSDLPGEIIGQVSENVFDTATGNHLLIPKGAKLFGRYDSQVSYGQNRLLVAWQRIIFPNGSTLEIGGMGGVDKTGSAGFEDQVDNHYWRLFTGAILTSIFSAGVQLSQPQTSNINGVQSTGQTIGAAVGQQIGQLGVSISQKNLAIAPTMVIRQGYRFSVMVDKDVVFPGVYQ